MMLLTTINVRRTMSSLVPLDTFETVFARMRNRTNVYGSTYGGVDEFYKCTQSSKYRSNGQIDSAYDE